MTPVFRKYKRNEWLPYGECGLPEPCFVAFDVGGGYYEFDPDLAWLLYPERRGPRPPYAAVVFPNGNVWDNSIREWRIDGRGFGPDAILAKPRFRIQAGVAP